MYIWLIVDRSLTVLDIMIQGGKGVPLVAEDGSFKVPGLWTIDPDCKGARVRRTPGVVKCTDGVRRLIQGVVREGGEVLWWAMELQEIK